MRYSLVEILENIDDAVEKYETLDLKHVSDQSEILRDLTTSLYFLEHHRDEAHKSWNSYYFNSKASSNAGKEREADFNVQELYQIRRVMTGAYKVVESIRSTISVYKKEL